METAHGRFCAHYWMGAALPVNAYHVSEVQAHRGDTVVDVRFDVYGQHLRSMTITTQALIMHYGNQCGFQLAAMLDLPWCMFSKKLRV